MKQSQYQSKSKCKAQQQQQQHPKKRHPLRTLAKIAVAGTAGTVTLTALGVVGAWQYIKFEAKNRRDHTPGYENAINIHEFRGRVHHDAHNFTLATPSMTYHLHDPHAVIAELAKAADKHTLNDDFEICIKAEVSPKGHYGYLGHLDYMLTVISPCDSNLGIEEDRNGHHHIKEGIVAPYNPKNTLPEA